MGSSQARDPRSCIGLRAHRRPVTGLLLLSSTAQAATRSAGRRIARQRSCGHADLVAVAKRDWLGGDVADHVVTQ